MCFGRIWQHSETIKSRKKYREKRKNGKKKKEKYYKSKGKHHKGKGKGGKSVEREIKNELINESAKKAKTKQSHRCIRQMEWNELKESKSPQVNNHYHKAAHDHALSPDNTLREITGDMPNIELKHVSSNETIYTDDELM